MVMSIEEMIANGMGRSVTLGAFSTPGTGGGAALVIDLDQPRLAIGIPAGYCIRPLYFEVVMQTGISTADSDETEALIAVDSIGLWTGDGTSTAENPSNMRTDLDKGSGCRVGSTFTADMTTTPGNGLAAADPVLDMELARLVETSDQAGTAANAVYTIAKLLYMPKYPPYIVGPATLLVYFGGTIATPSFCIGQWVEGPARDFLPAIAGL